MTKSLKGVRVIKTSVPVAVTRMKTIVSCYERQYNQTTDTMIRLVKNGEYSETAEIRQWLMNYHALKKLEEQFGAMTGSHTKGTRRRTIVT